VTPALHSHSHSCHASGLLGAEKRLSGVQHPVVPSSCLILWLQLCLNPPHFGLSSPGLHSLQETYEAKRKEFLSELQRKEEEMRQMFVNKVKETELELKEKEREVCAGFGHGWLCVEVEAWVLSHPCQSASPSAPAPREV
jgi:hypothetical protein